MTSAQMMETTTFAPRILVIEDNASLSRLYCKALQHAGYSVHPALTLEAAENLLNMDSCYDVVLCDMHMGSESSVKFLRKHRETFASCGTELIVITGQRQYQTLAHDLNIEFFLEKPVTIHELITLIGRLVNAYNR